MLRAAWITRDMLPTLGSDPGAVTLLPGTGGALEITSDGATIWERMRDGGLPDAKVFSAIPTRLRLSRGRFPVRPGRRSTGVPPKENPAEAGFS